MRERAHSGWLGWIGWLLVGLGCAAAAAQSPPPSPRASRPAAGEPAPVFALDDLAGDRHRPVDPVLRPPGEAPRAVVLVWWAATAAVSAKTDPEVRALARRFTPLGVRFFAINPFLDPGSAPGGAEDRRLAAEFKRLRGIDFPVLVDRHRAVTRRYGVRHIPEAVVIDARGVIRYRGAIVTPLARPGERQYRRYLHDALAAILDGQPVRPAETATWGTEVPYGADADREPAGRDPAGK